MANEIAPTVESGSVSGDYGAEYYSETYGASHEEYSWESDSWRTYFRGVAARLVGALAPKRTLDVGCARGILVQALAEIGVDSQGIDHSDYAISTASATVRDRLSVASATEPFEQRYDLITCIEVLEHLSPADAQKAIDNMCAASDLVLLSSTPGDFDEPTHINVHPTADWAGWFAERGFFRRTDVDTTFLSPWAILFEKSQLTPALLVHHYETLVQPLVTEVAEKRRALLDADRQLNELRAEIAKQKDALAGAGVGIDSHGVAVREVHLSDAAILKAHADLVTRDAVIGLQASVDSLQAELDHRVGRVAALRARVRRQREEIAALRSSRTWKIGRVVTGPLGKLK